MGLEQAFEAPGTLKRLRSGPLGHFAEGFCDWLLSQGFGRHGVRMHLGQAYHLNEYLGEYDDSPRIKVTARDVEGFWKSYPSRCRNRGSLEGHLRQVGHSIHRFTEYLQLEGWWEEWTEPPLYPALLDGYLEWMRDHQQVAAGTLRIRRHGVRMFLTGLGSQATVEGLSEFSAEQMESFFLDFAETKGRAARRSMQSALRTFLRFCLHQG